MYFVQEVFNLLTCHRTAMSIHIHDKHTSGQQYLTLPTYPEVQYLTSMQTDMYNKLKNSTDTELVQQHDIELNTLWVPRQPIKISHCVSIVSVCIV